MRTSSLFVGMVMACAMAGAAVAQDAPDPGYVYLRANFPGSPHKETCVQRNGFVRIGPQGNVIGPMDHDHIFAPPARKHFLLTDIHLFDENDTDTERSDQVILYLEGIQGEVFLWAGGMVVPAHGVATYERALASPILIDGPNEICNSAVGADQDHPPQLIVLGRLQ